MIGVPFQGQALLAGQGAAGFFALLGGNVGGNAAPSSTPFGALLAEFAGMNGQQAMTAAAALKGLSGLSDVGSQLPPELALTINQGLHNIPTDILAALNDLKNSLPALPAVDGVTPAGELLDLPSFDFDAAYDGNPTAAALPFLAALMAALPQPTAAPSLAQTETTGETAPRTADASTAKTGMAELLASLAAGLENAAGNSNEEPGLPAPQPLADNQNAKTVPADAMRAAHDQGIAGIELARLAGGRALAKGMGSVPEPSAPTPAPAPVPTPDLLDGGLEPDISRHAADEPFLRAVALKVTRQGVPSASQNTDASAASAQVNAPSLAKAENHIAAAVRALAMGDGKAPVNETDLLSPLSDSGAKAGSLSDTPLTPGVMLSHMNARGPAGINLSAPLATHVATQVAAHIGHAVRDGQNEFKIRLDPPELGRIEVKLEMHQDGRVSALLAADNEQTLQLFERHHGLLERALQDAGLKADAGSLSFTLSGGDKEPKSALTAHGDGNAKDPATDDGETSDNIVAVATLSDRALDIRV